VSGGSPRPAADGTAALPHGAAADETASGRGRTAAILATIAAVGATIALYLTVVKLSGGVPTCGPLAGCETVQSSSYSTVFGIPISAFGLAFQLTMVALVLGWWRTGDRRALLGAYVLGLTGVLVVAYLVYLQVAVIGAICTWCMAFDTTIVLGFVGAAVAYARTGTTRA
jgi:uncharacterized membrane protein